MPIPKILFKYRSLEPDGARACTLRTISHREIWFGSLADFNDPFEARVSVSMDGNDKDWRREFDCHRPDAGRLAAVVAELEEGVRSDAERLGVFCLSEKCDDIVMWSHYSACHRGVCFGFRTADSMFSDAQQVEYSDDYPQIKYFQMTATERVRKMLLTKASHWSYEREWRALRTGPPPGLEVYPVGSLAIVILGCQIRPSDREEIMALVARTPAAPEVYQARRSNSAFGLDVCDVARTDAPSNQQLEPTALAPER